MARDEMTSKRISTIAGRILREIGGLYEDVAPVYAMSVNSDLFLIGTSGKGRYLTAGDLRALAASALTQAADKPKRKRTKNAKKRSE